MSSATLFAAKYDTPSMTDLNKYVRAKFAETRMYNSEVYAVYAVGQRMHSSSRSSTYIACRGKRQACAPLKMHLQQNHENIGVAKHLHEARFKRMIKGLSSVFHYIAKTNSTQRYRGRTKACL